VPPPPTEEPTAEPTGEVTEEPTPEPTPALPVSLKLQYLSGNTSPLIATLKPQVRIVNTGIEDVSLELLKLRYYYTKEGSSPETATVDYAAVGSASVTTSLNPGYCEVGFIPGTGVLVPQNSDNGTIFITINKTDGSKYKQTGDWSFDSTKADYSDWDHITAYYDGALVWGVEPPVFNQSIVKINCRIDCAVSGGVADHWIPNTNEDSRPFTINIFGEDALGNPILLPENTDILMVAPADPNFETVDADNANIHRNKGSGFYFKPAGRTDDDRLAYFERSDTVGQGFIITVNPDCFADSDAAKIEAMPIDGYSLRVTANGQLIYTDSSGNIFNSFVLKAAGTVRPGDDILLQFRVAINGAPTVGTYAGSFLATYDKKMLWRANLYIHDGVNDWNNANPWIDSVNNEWYTSQANGAAVDGGQIPIRPWTKFDNGATITNAVAYGWGGTDSVNGFNSKLSGQTTAISQYRQSNGTYAGIAWSNNSVAPGNSWDNYLFPARIIDTINNVSFYRYDGAYTILDTLLVAQHPYNVSGSTACIPQLTTFIVFCSDAQRNPLPHNYNWYQTLRSAGADCTGFVSMSLLYTGRPYAISSSIAAWDYAENPNYTWSVTDPSLLVPGDVLCMPDTPAHANTHVVLVQSIRYSNNSRSVDNQSGLVTVIEATKGKLSQWCVMNSNTWNVLGANYISRRLRTNN
jgi:hypothetical protein